MLIYGGRQVFEETSKLLQAAAAAALRHALGDATKTTCLMCQTCLALSIRKSWCAQARVCVDDVSAGCVVLTWSTLAFVDICNVVSQNLPQKEKFLMIDLELDRKLTTSTASERLFQLTPTCLAEVAGVSQKTQARE